MATRLAYKLTGLAVLAVGILFFLRDIGVNLIGNTGGWTIFIVLIGAGLLAGGDIPFGSSIASKIGRK